ncbi:hypothetical protein [Mycobacterium lehmannii]|uniref:hypothetical protein n=1 Tax=Mycobacterium lehmannii TaxID=2048550 RepID=UPI000B940608|nr:hypothetical protein [Mycobacterium lehmannii]
MSAPRLFAHPRTWATYGVGEPDDHGGYSKGRVRLQVVAWDAAGHALVMPAGSDTAIRASAFESSAGRTTLLRVSVATKSTHALRMAQRGDD